MELKGKYLPSQFLLLALIYVLQLEQVSAQDSVKTPIPVFISEGVSRIPINSVYNYQLKAMDSANAPISFSTANLPSWLTLDTINNILTGKAVKAGQYPVTIFASNGKTAAAQHFMLTVYNKATVNILAIGNSITNGTSIYNSYRRDLWQELHAAGYNFDFIGSWNKHHMGGAVPDPDFDMDHEGHSGWNADHIFHPPDWDSLRGNLQSWLKLYTPDIVLLELGTNDIFQCRKAEDILGDFRVALQLIRTKNKRVKVFISNIIPLGNQWAPQKLCGNDLSYADAIKNINTMLPGFAASVKTRRSSVTIVDQFSGLDPAKDMYDDIHPNGPGEKIMADKWFEAIHPYIKKLN